MDWLGTGDMEFKYWCGCVMITGAHTLLFSYLFIVSLLQPSSWSLWRDIRFLILVFFDT